MIGTTWLGSKQLPGEVISMDGMSVLKIENTNDAPLVVSLLVISDALVIKKASFVYGEIKYENVKTPFRG